MTAKNIGKESLSSKNFVLKKMPLMHDLVYGGSENSDEIRPDIVVCIALDTTSVKHRRLFATQHDMLNELTNGSFSEFYPVVADLSELKASGPKLIQLVWCVCQVRDEFKVVDFDKAIVNHPSGIWLDDLTIGRSGVTQEMVSTEGVSVAESIEKLTMHLRQIYGAENSKRVKICSFGDWPVRYQLPLEALRYEAVQLPEAFSTNFINILELYYELSKAEGGAKADPVRSID